MEASDPTASILCRHAGFLRTLALEILHDESLADDAVQDAVVSTLSRERSEPPAIAWLIRVTRNAALRIRRSTWRRYAHEAEAAASEPIARAVEASERSEILLRVTQAVVELPETYRDTLIARHYDGLSPSEIAERSGVPLATVKSRLARAHAMLRERLDRESKGDRNTWRLGLLELTTPGGALRPTSLSPPASTLASLLAMKLSILTGAAVIAVASIAFLILRHDSIDLRETALGAEQPALEPSTLLGADETHTRTLVAPESVLPAPKSVATVVKLRPADGTLEGKEAMIQELEKLIMEVESDRDEHIRRALRWGRDGRQLVWDDENAWESLNPEHKSLSAEQKKGFLATQAPYDDALREAGALAFAGYLASLRTYYDRRMFIVLPSTDPEPPRSDLGPDDMYNRSLTLGAFGWKAWVRFTSKDFPLYQWQLLEIERLRAERERAMRDFIARL